MVDDLGTIGALTTLNSANGENIQKIYEFNQGLL